MKLTHARIFADADGESHFEDRTIMLQPADLAPPLAPVPISAPISAHPIVYYPRPSA